MVNIVNIAARPLGGSVSARAFTVAGGKVSPGICLADGLVAVGEKGRGRKLVTVPPPNGAEVVNDTAGSTLASVPAQPGTVVVLFRDHSGFRGGWDLRSVAPPERVAQFSADKAELDVLDAASAEASAAFAAAQKAWMASDGDGADCEALHQATNRAMAASGAAQRAREARAKELRAERERRWPTIRGAALIRALGGTLIAEGECAQGDAGTMGGGPEYLVRLPVGAVMEMSRTGRLYGAPAVLRVTVVADEGGGLLVEDPEALAASAKAGASW